ncbi:GNAT family N-acetyltransferase [Streptomyces sp. NPDC020379]|uniref:GNAT family N-acetyltransferase n=1 Tax=Streptomyces sp. NPDC020379 TaxID=3365071 RepID=UPI0037A8C4CF
MPDLRQLRAEAETWLAAAGIDQWRDPSTRPAALAKWEANIRDGRTWVIDNDDRTGLLATVTLAPPDRDFWRDADAPDSAVYIAKLITGRQAKGEHLGGRILDWAGSIACDRGLPWVRLDCWRDNTKLQDYYLRAGFRHVRTEAPTHRLSGWMAQRPASVVLYPGQDLTTADTPVSAL